MHSTVWRSGARRAGQWRAVFLGGSGAALVAAGVFLDRWLPGLMLVGFLMLGVAVALDGPAGLAAEEVSTDDAPDLWDEEEPDERE